MTLGPGQDGEQDGRPRPRLPAPQKQPIFSAYRLMPERSLADVVVCALLRHVESSGATPDRRSSSQPEALGAVQEVTNGLKHFKKRLR